MAYTDSWATCARCGRRFVFRVEEQKEQAKRGEKVAPPELCPACRPAGQAEQKAEPRHTAERRPGAEPGPGPHEGVVKWYEREKGYGFIIHPGGEEIFFHRTGIAAGQAPNFPDGSRVRYRVERTAKGLEAVDVARI